MPVRFYDDRGRKYSQLNNAAEKIFNGPLEFCGPTAAVMLIDCMGKLNFEITSGGSYRLQPEDYLSLIFNDPKYKSELHQIRKLEDSIFPNEVPQFYPFIIDRAFGVKCVYIGFNFQG